MRLLDFLRRAAPLIPQPDQEPPPHAITASVATVQLDGVGWQTWRPGHAWQNEAWRLYDITGQLRFVSNWIGQSVSRCRLYVAKVDESGEAGEEVTDPDIAQLAAGPLGTGPAKDEALRLLGILMFVPGEAYVVAESAAGDNGEDRWFVVSGRQMRRAGEQIIIRRSLLHGGGDMVFRPGIDLILRVWTPHPGDTDQPDSPTRSAIPDLRLIEVIRKREFAELDSRLAGAGILPLPEGVDFPRGPNDDASGIQSFTDRLGQTMSRSMADRSSAEAMVPLMFTVPMDALGKIQPVTFWSPLSDQLIPLYTATVISLAQSLDVPPEILLGSGNQNHWSAWQTSDEAITTQIQPVLSRIADALTTGYLRIALEKMGYDPDEYVYAFDVAALVVRPNRATDALNFHGANLISDDAAVAAGAFTVDQMPSPEERIRRILETAAAGAPELLSDPVVWKLLGMTGPPPAGLAPGAAPGTPPPPPEVTDPKGIPEGQPPADPKSPPGQPAPEPKNPGQPTPQPANPGQAPAHALDHTAAVIAVAGQATRRALGLAGTRLVPHGQRALLPEVARHQLHAHHGPISATHADQVLRGAWDDLPAVAEDLHLDPAQMEKLLHGFACELLTRGMAYDQLLLRDLVMAAMGGQRLNEQLAVAA